MTVIVFWVVLLREGKYELQCRKESKISCFLMPVPMLGFREKKDRLLETQKCVTRHFQELPFKKKREHSRRRSNEFLSLPPPKKKETPTLVPFMTVRRPSRPLSPRRGCYIRPLLPTQQRGDFVDIRGPIFGQSPVSISSSGDQCIRYDAYASPTSPLAGLPPLRF